MPKMLRWLAPLVVLGLAAACSTDSSSDSATPTTAARTSAAAVSLEGVCPEKLVLQTDWFPEAEYGAYYSLIGPNGTVDADKGAYSGPLMDTGVELEIRAGGPFIGQQTVQSLMYQDDTINLGLVHTDDAVRFSKQLPVVGVMGPLEHSPLAVVWDKSVHTINSWADVGASGGKVLVFTKAVNYVPFLINKGLVPEANFDDSFDGSYSRFTADNSLIQQAFVTETPFRLQNEITAYGKEVGELLVSESGYDPYLSSLSVKASDLEALKPCLAKLVPLVQQAQVDYMKDPTVAHGVMVDVATKLDTFWTLSPELLAFGNEKMAEYDIVSNGDDSTLGNFDTARGQ